MVIVEDCIFGNSALHDRFFAATEILARLVSSVPRAVSMAQLEDATGRSGRELTKLCAALSRAGLLRQDAQAQDKWMLTCDPSDVTLEDEYNLTISGREASFLPAQLHAWACSEVPPSR